MKTENQNSIEASQPKKMAKMYQKMPFLKILLFLWHFCRFLWLGCLYWILVFSFHLVRPRHNFWCPYLLYLWEKNISWTKGGPFDFLENPNSTAGSSLWPIELKFFVVISIDHGNEKNCLANFSSIFFTFWTPLLNHDTTLNQKSPRSSGAQIWPQRTYMFFEPS